MSAAFVIARLMLRELLRRRLLLALFALTAIAIALTGWGFSRIPSLSQRGVPISETQVRLVASQLLILVMFMFSNVVALSAAFVAAPALSADVESGMALAILARPLSRGQFVLGKWLGLAALVVGFAVCAGTAEMLVVNAVVGYVPPRPFEFFAFLAAAAIVLLTFALLLSTRFSGMVGAVAALILSGMAWLGGIVGGIGAAFDNAVLERVGTATSLILPTDGLWRGAVWALEPAATIAAAGALGPASAANPFFQPAPPPPAYLVWCVAWTAGVLLLAMRAFEAREL